MLNQAAAAALMGAQVALVGCVGDDVAGQEALQALDRAGVDRSRVRTLSGEATGTAFITVDQRGNNTIVVIAGANGKVAVSQVEEVLPAIRDFSAIMLQFEVPDEVLQAVVEATSRLRSSLSSCPMLVLNPSPFRRPALPAPGSVDLLIVNEVEAEAMTGSAVTDPKSAAAAASRLLDWVRPGGRVVITLGAQGAVAASHDYGPGEMLRQVFYVPPVRVNVVDTTGAGDVFAGAMTTELAAGRALSDALRLATAAAAICVARPGAQASFPTRSEAQQMMEKVPDVTLISP